MTGADPSELVATWREQGYVIVPLLSPAEVADVLSNIHDFLPTWDEVAADPRQMDQVRDPANCRRTFPFSGIALNAVTVHPTLVGMAEEILRTEDLMVNESQVIGKYAAGADYEQQLHVDYGNTTLVCPPPDEAATDLPMIAYYTDVTLDLGPTYLVPRAADPGGSREPRQRSRESAPALYEAEIPLTVPAGSVLVYSMNTWHRGSAMTASAGSRYSHHLGFRRRDTPWCGQFTFVASGGTPEMDAFLTGATPRQRCLVGFPGPGDSYWTPDTRAGVSARYPSMDMAAYR